MANRTCSVDQCTSPVKSRGWCAKHYMRWQRGTASQDVLGPAAAAPAAPRKVRGVKECRVCGQPFGVRRDSHSFCSQACREKSRISRHTGRRVGSRSRGLLASVEDAIAAGDRVAARSLLVMILLTHSKPDGSCWIWQSRKDRHGYPRAANLSGVTQALHRHIAEQMTGQPLVGMHAHHACARRDCVNPDHIMAVTAAQNVAEMMARKSYEGRIWALEQALAALSPNHPLLTNPVEKTA